MPSGSSGADSGWQIIDEPSYEVAVASCGSYQFFDRALAPIEYALNRNPAGFHEVPGYPGVHIAKTKLIFLGPEIIPSYRVWFRIDIDKRIVFKLWVELAAPEDMGLWDDEDKIPF